MNKNNITSAEYIYDIHDGHKGMIKVTANNKIFWVPNNTPENKDYKVIQEWIAEGGVIIDKPPTQENI